MNNSIKMLALSLLITTGLIHAVGVDIQTGIWQGTHVEATIEGTQVTVAVNAPATETRAAINAIGHASIPNGTQFAGDPLEASQISDGTLSIGAGMGCRVLTANVNNDGAISIRVVSFCVDLPRQN